MPRLRALHTRSMIGIAAMVLGGGIACFGTSDPQLVLDDPPPPDAVESPTPSVEARPWVRLVPPTAPGARPVGEDVLAGHCQPERFVPDEFATEEDKSKPPFLKIVGDEVQGRNLTIDKTDLGLKLAPGIGLTAYAFVCDGVEDEVVQVYRDGLRANLVQHLIDHTPSPDGDQLYMVHHALEGDAWVRKAVLTDNQLQTTATLAPADCVGFDADWTAQGLITLGSNPAFEDTQDACLWDLDGTQLGHVQFEAGEQAAVGLASADPPLLFIGDPVACRVAVVDLRSGEVRVDDTLTGEADCMAARGASPMTAADFQTFGRVVP